MCVLIKEQAACLPQMYVHIVKVRTYTDVSTCMYVYTYMFMYVMSHSVYACNKTDMQCAQ